MRCRAYQCYGSGAKEMILANPYLLCGMGIELPFEKAELLADDLKVPKNAEQRILAGTCYILEHNHAQRLYLFAAGSVTAESV